MADDPISAAFRRGCPVLSAELVLGDGGLVAREHLDALRRGAEFPMPRRSPVVDALRDSGIEPTLFTPPPGIYAMGWFSLPGDDQPVGTVRHLTPQPVEPSGLDAAFLAACDAGVEAAENWLLDRLGLISLPTTKSVRPAALTHGAGTGECAGESAGLAAALAWAFELAPVEARAAQVVAATGRADPWGRVCPVERIPAKVLGAVRELPDLEWLIIPADCAAAMPEAVPKAVEVHAVQTVAEALDLLFPNPDASWLPALDPHEAARLVQEHEVRQEHWTASTLAQLVLETSNQAAWQHDPDWAQARLVAASIDGINCVHGGRPKEARVLFRRLREELQAMSVEVRQSIFTLDFEALLAAKEASALIDTLDPAAALSALEPVETFVHRLAIRPRVEVLGSWTRALALAGDLDGALGRAKEQLGVVLPARFAAWHSQRVCNLLDVLLRRHAAGVARALDEAEDWLAEARASNQTVRATAARQSNAIYLALWDAKIAARRGDVPRARAAAGELQHCAGHFPALFIHRFVGEAMLAAGDVNAGLGYLDATMAAIDGGCGPFERLVLSTAGAIACAARVRRGDVTARPDVASFISRFRSWSPAFVAAMDPGEDPSALLLALIARLPY